MIKLPLEVLTDLVETASGIDCKLIWWPNELQIPYFDGKPGFRTIAPSTAKLTPAAARPAAEDRKD